MRTFATFNEEGFPTGFYREEITPNPPEGAVEITEDQWLDFLQNPGFRRWVNGEVVPYTPPPQPLPPYGLSISSLWSSMTDAEAEEFDAAMATASPLRLRRAFNTASSLTSGSELFVFVVGVLSSSIGAERAEELTSRTASYASAVSSEELA